MAEFVGWHSLRPHVIRQEINQQIPPYAISRRRILTGMRLAQRMAATNPLCATEIIVMGANRRNVEAVTDFADGRHFIRLHRDILLPAGACEAVRRHLTAGRWEQAKHIALEHATADAHEEIRLFFDSTAEILTAEQYMTDHSTPVMSTS